MLQSERRRMEEELRASELRWRRLFEQSPLSIQTFSPDGATRQVNRAWEKLFSATKADLTHYNILKDPQLEAAGVMPLVRRAFEGEAVSVPPIAYDRGAAPGQDHGQGLRWIGATLSPLLDAQGRVLEVVLVHEDITKRKEAEQEILRLNASLEQRVAERTVELVQANQHLQMEVAERRRQQKIQQATYQISEAVHTADDLPSFYARVHAIVKTLMPAHNFYIALLEAATNTISFPYFVDEQAKDSPSPRPIGKGLTGVVLRLGRPLLVDRKAGQKAKRVGNTLTLEGTDLTYVESGREAAIWLGAPLLYQGRAFGVMAVQDYANEAAYGESEKHILTFVAEQTALAISRKKAEQALRDSEEQHRALFEAASQGVMLHDERAFFSVNPAAVRILGFTNADELLGKHPADLATPRQPDGEESRHAAQRHIERCRRDGSARFEWLIKRPDGAEVLLDVLLTAIELSGRNIIQAVVEDITTRKQAEAELLKTVAREKELSQLRSSFVSMVSHEFRTPLGILQSSAEILEDYLDQLEPEERKEHLQSIHKNTRRMAALMEEVLLIGSFDAGKMDFKPMSIELPGFLHKLVDELHSATNRSCPIELTLTPDLPETAQTDERLLRHILTNLLANAVKYSDPGKPVEFDVRREGAEMVCSIRDHGIGDPAADQEWLFSAFHRGSNVGNRHGTGLGLVIVKRCADMHGGKIKVESKPGQGTTMTVRLPVFNA